MENSAMPMDGKSPAEKFKIWKDSYLSFSALPAEQRIFIEKWSAIFDKIPEDSYLKAPLFNILVNNLSGAWGCSVGLERLRQIQPCAEHLLDCGCFEDALTFMALFWKQQDEAIASSTEYKHCQQTAEARKTHSAWNQMKPQLKVLWNYLEKVEFALHPLPEEGKERPKRSMINEQEAVRRIFRDYKTEIMALLPDYQEEADAKKVFAKVFRVYTAAMRECNGKTATGYVPEKRAPRSEASKEKARQTALKKRREKK